MDLFHGSTESEFDAILAEMEKEMSLGDIVKELGYGCTFDALHCKEILSPFLPLSEVTISKILGTIARNLTGLEDNQSTFSTFGLALGCDITTDLQQLSSWDVDILVKTIKQLVSPVLFLLS
jgi:CCR4-NOT transcription complex subunit 1